jgi:hypothetical protein
MSTCPTMPRSGQVDTFIRQFRFNEDRDRYREDDPDVTFDAGRSVTSATLPATGIVHNTALLPLSDGSAASDHVPGATETRAGFTLRIKPAWPRSR